VSDDTTGLTLDDDEWREVFNNPDDAIEPRPTPRWVRLIGGLVALGLVLSGATSLIGVIRELNSISEPTDVVARADAWVAQSPWGWLVTDVVITPIPEPRVGAFVVNNPPDGIIHIDDRSWGKSQLDELMAHEIGHLIDFAVFGDRDGRDRRAGLEQEVWAECAAVAAGQRGTDSERNDERYRCRGTEFAVYEAAVAELGEVCKHWGVPECRLMDLYFANADG